MQSTLAVLRKSIEDVPGIVTKRLALSKLDRVIPTNYSRKRKRYTNDLSKCNVCKEWIDLDTCDHILTQCKELHSSPVKKRSRRNYLSNGFCNRLLEFTLLEKNNFEKIDKNEPSNFMVP